MFSGIVRLLINQTVILPLAITNLHSPFHTVTNPHTHIHAPTPITHTHTTYLHSLYTMQAQASTHNHIHKTCLVKKCCKLFTVLSYIHTIISEISIAPLQVYYYSEALPTTALILCRS